ncbi:hypothetical protein CRENBAI_021735 [Crenichthys baileyi]|uniref:PB1 domain-containing protein n=1 Tax=Crenichthys baileyi TaxID=28760 RepID=A0AAV9QU71_9TELE
MDSVALKVVIEHRSEKLTLSSGIPSTVEQLQKTVKETFGLIEDFTLHYLDEEFGDYFTLHSTNQLKHKGIIKVVIIPPVVLTLTALTENQTDVMNDSSSSATVTTDSQTDNTSASSQDTIILSPHGSTQTTSWPSKITIPLFSGATEAVLKNANEVFVKDGTVLNNTQIRSEIMEKLADYMYSYTPYPTGLQIVKNKHPDDRSPAKNIKKARKGEVVFLPHYPAGDSKEQQELDRNQLIAESKKRDSTVIKDSMSRTFAHRRHDVVRLQMSISDIKDRWPALFDVSQSGIPIQQTREVVIRCLISHLGEDADALFKDFEKLHLA